MSQGSDRLLAQRLKISWNLLKPFVNYLVANVPDTTQLPSQLGGKPILDVSEHFDDAAALGAKGSKEQGLKFGVPAVYSFMNCHGEK